MNVKTLPFLQRAIVSIGLGATLSFAAMAAETLPGPADVGRIKPEENMAAPDHSQDQQITVPAPPLPTTPAPKAVNSIFFTLKTINIEGMTAFTPEQMADIYTPFIGKEVPLDIAWITAESITDRYHAAGYFLSLAYVPDQSIEDGIVTIKVVEGYVGKVKLPDDFGEYRVVQEYIDRLTARRPVTSNEVESFLLRLNDLPGYSFRAVLSPLKDRGKDNPAVELLLEPATKESKGIISYDNFSSRYLGPNEASVSYSISVLPLQQTTVTGLSATPADKLRYGTIDHTVPIAPDTSLEVTGGVTKAYPGYTLEPEEIDSLSRSESLILNYQWVRQREENLALKLTLDSQDVTSDILHAPLTRDIIRALRLGATYDANDGWHGYNVATLTVSRGIDGLGSSQKGDPDLSRADADPNFTKADLSLSRLQGIDEDWSLYAATSGQLAIDGLYSSEQFGYGGQAFGRAYDTSDITGDQGVAGSLELRYGGWSAWQTLSPQPYAFYDFGRIWNESAGQVKNASGASTGFGFRFTTPWQQTGNLGLAWPLTRNYTPPIYGEGKRNQRLLLQITQEFK